MTTLVRRRVTRDAASARRSPKMRRIWSSAAMGAAVLVFLSACTATKRDDSPAPPSPGGLGTVATGGAAATGTDLIAPDPDGEPGNGSAAAASDSATQTAPKGPPAAAELSWLDGSRAESGVVVGGGATQHWVGRTPGETATLGDRWYRYFGADGSLVGCTSAGACVGVGSDGTVAVTHGPGDPREVYQSNGRYLGRYSADGDKLGAATDPVELDRAMVDSKVDIAGLVNAAGRGTPFSGGVTGDPHLITMGGQRYSTQATGQFSARSGDDDHKIDLEFSAMPHRDDVSIVSMMGIGTGSDTVTYSEAGVVTVNGENLSPVTEFTQKALAGGVTLGQWPADGTHPETLAVVWSDGGSVVAAASGALGLTIVAHLPPSPTATGLFGDASVRSGPDLAGRSGAVAATPGGVRSAVAAWRAQESDALLPHSSTPPTEPDSHQIDIDPAAQKVAERLCSGVAMPLPHDRDACAFDVALTGDTGFIPGHVALATAAQAPGVPADFAHRWPALTAGPLSTATTLPDGGGIDVSLSAGESRLYRFTTTEPGPVQLVDDQACAAATADAPILDQPGWRLFDDRGRPVADRLVLCGQTTSGAVPAGDYLLVVANGVGAPTLPVRAAVTLP